MEAGASNRRPEREESFGEAANLELSGLRSPLSGLAYAFSPRVSFWSRFSLPARLVLVAEFIRSMKRMPWR